MSNNLSQDKFNLSNEFKLVCIQKLTELEFKIRLLNGVIYNYIVIC